MRNTRTGFSFNPENHTENKQLNGCTGRIITEANLYAAAAEK
jgi:hypothetical protein